MHKISLALLGSHYRPDTDLDQLYSIIRAAGIDGIDFSLEAGTFGAKNGYEDNFYKKDMAELKAIFARFKDALDRNGLVVNQTHTPFPTYKFGEGQEDYNAYLVEATHKCIELTAFLGGKYAIVHPAHSPNTVLYEEEKAANMAFYPQFIETAKKFGVKICLENMWGRRGGAGACIFDSACADPREACEYIDELNAIAGEEIFCFCFDVGHANLCGKHMQNTIRRLGHRLQTLHIHDTNKLEDVHTIPYSFCAPGGAPVTDWQGMLMGLRDIGYKGYLNFEAMNAFRCYPAPLHPALCGMFHAIGEYFSTEIEK